MIIHLVEETGNYCLTPVVDVNDSRDAFEHEKKKNNKN